MLGKLYLFLPYLFVFIASLYRPYDADLGWHLKYGEYFFKTGRILQENTFSTMMPDFIWPNTSWGIDIINYLAFSSFGFLGLTLLGALTVTLTFFFFGKAFALSFFEKALIFPLIVWLESPINQVSFRGSLTSLLFLSMLFYVLSEYERSKKKLFFVVPLFLIWANIHGLFILGLALFGIWIGATILLRIYSLYKEKNKEALRDIKILAGSFVFSAGATLIHPFGFEIYKNALVHFRNPDLLSIAEYLPFSELSNLWWKQLVVGVLIFFGFIFLYFSDKLKDRIPTLGIITILYAMTWFVRRYAWSLYYLTIPFLQPLAQFFKPNSEKVAQKTAIVIFLFLIGIAVYLKLPLQQYKDMSWDIYCRDYIDCSQEAARYVIENKLDKNILTLYNWGGWLIWNYPEIKPTIDGRMHLWRDNKGYSAFSEYYPYEQNQKDVDKWKYDVVLFSPQKPMYDRLLELVKQKKWKLAYEDNYAGVFVRNR